MGSESLCRQITEALSGGGAGEDTFRPGWPRAMPGGGPPTDLTLLDLAASIQLLCQRGTRLFGSDAGGPRRAGRSVETWRACQRLAEKYVSGLYLRNYRFIRSERRWDDLLPSEVGNIHDLGTPAPRRYQRWEIVIGEPCPACLGGRVCYCGPPGDADFGIRCNGACGFARRTAAVPIGRTLSERAVWCEPTLPDRVPTSLPYAHLGCPVVPYNRVR